MGLVDHRGQPISSDMFKKASPPKMGEAFGQWANRDLKYVTLPGGGVVQFDLSKLTVADFRSMRDHYQVNASLSVLSFMLHQSDWTIECEDKKIAEACENWLREVWTPLNRSMGTSNWAGFSPNVLQWENDVNKNSVVLAKIKDLVPEECGVNWKPIDLWAPPGKIAPKSYIYDGIKQWGAPYPIPVENSYWYPILMENGDYYGRKLLRPAFQSWFFSILVHLFANRYYERFGEPVPVGRAPFEDEIEVGGTRIKGNTYMLGLLQELRNRSVVVLPNDATDLGEGKLSYDYSIEYLESQMRGADFERYLTRLDEEVSLGIFTPILLMRTAEVGSYNLGVGHMQLWLWMLNALNDDRGVYIDKYILSRMVDFNFSPKAPRAKIKFRKLGKADSEMVRTIISALISGDKAKPDLVELGQMAGLTLSEVQQVTKPAPRPGEEDDDDDDTTSQDDTRVGRTRPEDRTSRGVKARASVEPILENVFNRVSPQVRNALDAGRFGADLKLTLGYKRGITKALVDAGYPDASARAESFYGAVESWVKDAASPGGNGLTTENFMQMFSTVARDELARVTDAA